MNTIHRIRPSLKVIAPLTFNNVIMFIWLNFFLALALYSQSPNPSLVIVGSASRSYMWSGVFVILGLGHLYGLLANNWRVIRTFLAAGLFVKLIFTYALLVLGFEYGFRNVIGTLSIWAAVTWVQYFTLRYFDKQRVLNVK